MFSVEAEQSVIGGLLIDPNACDRIDFLAEGDFYVEDHRLIFRAITLMLAERKPVDVVTIAEFLKSSGVDEQRIGLAHLGELVAGTPSAANVRRYAEVVRDKRLLRDLLAASADVSELARKAGPETAAQRIEAAQEKFLALSSGQSDSREPEEIGAALPRLLEAIEQRRDRALGPCRITTQQVSASFRHRVQFSSFPNLLDQPLAYNKHLFHASA